jgi:ABC-type transport system involved in multi-copper enzyme maturation permease subunit
MSAALRSELLKQRTTRTNTGLLLSLVGLVLFVVVFHGVILPKGELAHRTNQVTLLGWGTVLGALFAALLGATSVTGEFRYGTIRPTLLATPKRRDVVTAKVCAGALAGIALGLVAEGLAAGLGSGALAARGIHLRLDAGDYVLLVLGGSAAAGLWAAIGVGIAALVRNQTATIVGLCAWLLLIETLLLGDLPAVGRFAPGGAAGALAGATAAPNPAKLLAPVLGALLLAAYAVAITAAASVATIRRDIR